MYHNHKYKSLFSTMLPYAAALLVLCITAGYSIYRYASERAYHERWKDYNDCGLA